MWQPVLVSQVDSVRTLTFNCPAAGHALTEPFCRALCEALDAAATDSAIRCLVLTGGTGTFSVGESAPNSAARHIEDTGLSGESEAFIALLERLRTMPMPTLAVVQGCAAGRGMALALTCDLVVATKLALFKPAAAASVAGTGLSWVLPRILGRTQALGCLLLQRPISGEEAARLGLIWRSETARALPADAQGIARWLAGLPKETVAPLRLAMDHAHTGSLREAVLTEMKLPAPRAVSRFLSELESRTH
jgi:2-(1,2-epoxy-1,2-dihydrophenyl)acetyl-CoA isomerase